MRTECGRVASAAMFALVLGVASTQVEASELSAGVSLGWIQAGTAPRLAVGPHAGIYSSRLVEGLEGIERKKSLRATPPRAVTIFVHDTAYILPAWVGKLIKLVKPELVEPPSMEDKPTRQVISFELSPDEQPYAAGIAQEIEATWGYERMPPEVGNVVVPDVATNLRRLGEARLYDCLFSDAW
ncbi:hypothetical protein WME73_35945 [Sorangium sp. So ce302]|uniref:hypothetical protein n=1 Tax=Sorangium sp. So ce302 TaxID=3133297 RepID=UPI003F6225E2